MAQVRRIVGEGEYCFFDAHWCKTIHDLSHLLMAETVNHVVGPMTPPLTSETQIHKVMGVNEKVHPDTIRDAYNYLHRAGIQNVGGVVIVAGLSAEALNISVLDNESIRKHTIVDELSPYVSLVSLGYGSNSLGKFLVKPSDFGISIDPAAIQVENKPNAIHDANIAALSGTDDALADYLAMNSALGILAFEDVGRSDLVVGNRLNYSYLRDAFERCRNAISNGTAMSVLENYVQKSGGTFSLATA
jgi:anthranilate phosphoribosyltransferase